jgi:hypothetical protein
MLVRNGQLDGRVELAAAKGAAELSELRFARAFNRALNRRRRDDDRLLFTWVDPRKSFTHDAASPQSFRLAGQLIVANASGTAMSYSRRPEHRSLGRT